MKASQWFAAGCGFFSVLVAGLVMFGWFTQNQALVLVHPSFVPMQFNTALGFMLCGMALCFSACAKEVAARLAAGAGMVLGVLTLIQYAFDVNLGIDTLVIDPFTTVRTSHPGRPAANTALAFTLFSGAVLWSAPARALAARGLLSTITMSMGLMALFGYLIGIETAYGWGSVTGMAVHTATNFTLLGLGLFIASLAADTRSEGQLPAWSVSSAVIVVFTTFVFLWMAQTTRELNLLKNHTLQAAKVTAKDLTELIDGQIQALDRMGRRWTHQGGMPNMSWALKTRYQTNTEPGLVLTAWLDQDLNPSWMTPQLTDQAWAPMLKATVQALGPLSDTTLSPPLLLPDHDLGYLVVQPLHTERPDGVLVQVMSFRLLQSLSDQLKLMGFELDLEHEGRQVAFASASHHVTAARTLELGDRTWECRIVPGPRAVAEFQTILPYVTLFGGALFSLLVGFCLVLLIRGRTQIKDLDLAREQLEKLNRGQKEILDTMPVSIIGVDEHGTVQFLNQSAVDLTGYTIDALRGQRIEALVVPSLREGHRQKVDDYLAQPLHRGMVDGLAIEVIHQSGRRIPVEIGLNPVDGEMNDFRILASLIDVTKKREQERLIQNKTRDLERSNQDLEQFAVIAAHDLREPLRKITIFAGMVAGKTRDLVDQKTADRLDAMMVSAQRMQDMLSGLQAYSRISRSELPFTSLDLNDVVAAAAEDLSVLIEESGTQLEVGPLPTIFGDRDQIRRVFQNLIANAVKFQKPETTPLIRIQAETRGENQVITVSDNGIGLENQFAEQIFQVFQRLHGRDRYPGAGVGLSICRKVIERHGGRIRAEGVLDQGACFTIQLPVYRGEPPMGLDVPIA